MHFTKKEVVIKAASFIEVNYIINNKESIIRVFQDIL